MPTLTRQELYDLVWSTPMTKLAERFGISDVGLAKICDRHRDELRRLGLDVNAKIFELRLTWLLTMESAGMLFA